MRFFPLRLIAGQEKPDGGELKLVARGANELEFAYDPPMNSGNPRLSAADAAAFAQILAQ